MKLVTYRTVWTAAVIFNNLLVPIDSNICGMLYANKKYVSHIIYISSYFIHTPTQKKEVKKKRKPV